MSAGKTCSCDETKKPIELRAWVVTTYKSNCSAFNGYRRQASDYSQIQCRSCLTTWRTKADYVDKLKIQNTIKVE